CTSATEPKTTTTVQPISRDCIMTDGYSAIRQSAIDPSREGRRLRVTMRTESEQTAIDCWKRGTDLVEQNRHDEAMEEFTKALNANPNWALPYVWRAMEWAELQEHRQAEFDFGTFIERYGNESMTCWPKPTPVALMLSSGRAIFIRQLMITCERLV